MQRFVAVIQMSGPHGPNNQNEDVVECLYSVTAASTESGDTAFRTPEFEDSFLPSLEAETNWDVLSREAERWLRLRGWQIAGAWEVPQDGYRSAIATRIDV